MRKSDYAKLYTLRSDGRYQGYWHDSNGKRHSICDRDAKRLYDRIIAKETHRDMTCAEMFNGWFGEHREQVGYKTAEAYRAHINRLCGRFGKKAITDVTPHEIAAYLVYLGSKGYSRRSVQMARDVINMSYNWAIMQNAITSNPCSCVKMPSGLKTNERELPSDDAMQAVLDNTEKPFGLFAAICLLAGLRRGEVLALRYEDIDRTNKVIHITKAVEYIGNNPHIKQPKTEKSKRDVVLPDALDAILPKKKKGYIFSQDGKDEPLTKTMVYKRWRAYCKEIGHDITAHQLRHGYATILFEAGVDVKDAQDQLGHTNIMTTQGRYTHIRQQRRNMTASKINTFLADGKLDSRKNS